jgi:hypothetical protein
VDHTQHEAGVEHRTILLLRFFLGEAVGLHPDRGSFDKAGFGGAGSGGAGFGGAGCDGAGCDGAGCDGTGCDGAGFGGTGFGGAGCDGAAEGGLLDVAEAAPAGATRAGFSGLELSLAEGDLLDVAEAVLAGASWTAGLRPVVVEHAVVAERALPAARVVEAEVVGQPLGAVDEAARGAVPAPPGGAEEQTQLVATSRGLGGGRAV